LPVPEPCMPCFVYQTKKAQTLTHCRLLFDLIVLVFLVAFFVLGVGGAPRDPEALTPFSHSGNQWPESWNQRAEVKGD